MERKQLNGGHVEFLTPISISIQSFENALEFDFIKK